MLRRIAVDGVCAEAGLVVADWMKNQPGVANILHPALPGCAGHDLWKRDFTGVCGLFGIELQPMAEKRVEAMLNRLKLFGLGFSWGGFESLAILSKPTRTAKPWTGGPLIRLHVGLEDTDDLIADLDQAMEVWRD